MRVSGFNSFQSFFSKRFSSSEANHHPSASDSTQHHPVKFNQVGLPGRCYKQKVHDLIVMYESGKLQMKDFPADHSVSGDWETWSKKGKGTDRCPGGEVKKTGDYCWKFLSDREDSFPMGVSVRYGPYNNTPHYHQEPECFYVLKGQSMLNVAGRYVEVSKGDVISIDRSAIHDLTVSKETTFAHLWWFPDHAPWKSVKYYWRKDAKNPQALKAFNRVDHMKKAAGLDKLDHTTPQSTHDCSPLSRYRNSFLFA